MSDEPACLYKGCEEEATTERTITLGNRIDLFIRVAPEAQLHTIPLCANHAAAIDAYETSKGR